MRRLQLPESVTRRQARFVVALLLVSVVASLPFGTPAANAAGTVEYSANISNTDNMSEAPSADVNAGRVAAIWGERKANSLGIVSGSPTSSLGSEGVLNTGTNAQYQFPDIEVDGNGTLHIAYGAGDTIFYRNKPRGGSWSSAVKVASDSFPNPVRLAVAPNGTIWVVWRDTDGKHVGFRFSDNGGGGWSGGGAGGIVAAESGNMSSPDIAIGPDNIPHVVWYLRSSGSDKGDVKYADWNGSRFTSGKLTNDGSGLYDADPQITVDGQNVQHVSFRKLTGSNWAIYAAARSGSSWRDFTTVGTTNGDAGYSPAIGSDPGGSVYVTFSSLVGSQRKIVLAAQPSGQSWGRQDLTNGSRWDTRSAVAGSNSSGQKAHVFFQRENRGRDDGEIYYNRVSFSSNIVNADPTIDAGTAYTRNPSVTVTFSAVQGNPTEMRWRWGAAPTDQLNDSGGWQTYQSPRQINLPVPEGGCGALTLYTQVKAGNNLQATAQYDSITYDDNVDASVAALNPNTAGLASSYADGANAGAAGYTRETAYNFVLNGADDCGGLKSYKINSGPETTISGNGAFVTNLPFGAQASGTKTVDVVVTDNAGNQKTYNNSILLDLPGDGKPVVASATVKIGGGNALQQTITLTKPNVDDNLYGPAEGLPDNGHRQFWGVFVATSRTQIASGDVNGTTGLAWTPIRVADPAADTIEVPYNVTSGLNVNGLSGAAGTYYVYVKFIDGAGNPSEWTSDALPVTLTAGYSVNTTQAPIINTAK